METKFKTLKLILILVLFAPIVAFSKSYDLYLCGTGTATLQPTIPNIGATDEVIWVDVTGGTNTTLQTATGAGINLVVNATGLAVGEHTYRVHAVSASPNSCTGDYKEITFYVLPAITVTANPTATPDYCENAATKSSIITANAAALATDLTDIEYTYTWEVTKDGSTVTGVGSPSTSGNTFELTTTTVGSYTFAVTSGYKIKTGQTGILRSTCTTTSAASTAVKVNAKPETPTIITIL